MRVGDYELVRPLGHGGMGTVWLATGPRGPVALKVLTSDAARGEDYATWLRGEVRAMAILDHPGIARVLDVGRLTSGAGELRAGSPWLCMEYLPRGDLSRLRGQVGWPRLRALLRTVLDALAHAHARDLVHLDIKPANVLLGGPERLCCLTDFGIAAYTDDAEHPRTADGDPTGTPGYMAPEQIRADHRALGPWTDLFGLGALAWSLATGSRPFAPGGSPLLAVARTLRGELGAFEPRHPMPEALEAWLRRALHLDPARRFLCAAEAARALPPADAALTAVEVQGAGGEAAPDATTVVWSGSPRWTTGQGPRAAVPDRWEAPVQPPPPVGDLALHALRARPMVGRRAARDALWSALQRVADGGGPQAVVVSGEAGLGKSRLVRWLARRGHEVGALTTLRALHGPVPGPRSGLDAMLARALRTQGLEGDALVARVDAALALHGPVDAALVSAVAAVLSGGAVNHATRLGVTGQVLGHLAARRPVLLWLEDVQWGFEALTLAEHVLGGDHRVLVVLTCRDDLVELAPLARTWLDDIRGRARTRGLALDRLAPEEHAALVAAHGITDAATLERVVDHTGGHPQHAVTLIEDWVAAGVLVRRDGGWVLSGADSSTTDMAGIAALRLARFLDGRDEAEVHALELAAVLGRDVDGAEWDELCGLAGLGPHPALAEALLDEALAVREPTQAGWSFHSELLVEALNDRAAERGRLQAHHRLAALLLDGRAPLRQVHHLEQAGDPSAAVDVAIEAFDAGTNEGDYVRLGELNAAAGRLLGRLDPEGRADPRWPRYWLHRASMLRFQGSLAQVEEALAHASRGADGPVLGRMAGLRARMCMAAGRPHEARERATEAIALLGAHDPAWLAAAWHDLATIHVHLGDLEEAERCYLASHRHIEGADHDALATLLLRRARVARLRGDAGRATALLAEALAWDRPETALRVRLDLAQEVGEQARLRGDLDTAWEAYERTYALGALVSPATAEIMRINLAWICLLRGEAERALQLALPVAALAHARGWHRHFAVAESLCALGEALLGAWDRCGERVERAAAALGPQRSEDVADAMDRIAALAADAALAGRASELAALARP